MTIPVKPSEATFTDEQWQAIWASGQDMLVSAAAGSGKTMVLITRMIEKVIHATNPIDVDQLLVVTFTNAAAAEMRQRMGEALKKEIESNPESAHLRRQLNLLNKAQISTLHAFCQHVVRQYAYLLNIDPGFRVADQAESALIRDDALSDVLEAAYRQADPTAIYQLADSFTTDRSDAALEVLIDRLYDYSRVHPQPAQWLEQIPAQYAVTELETVDELSFIDPLKKSIQYTLEEAMSLLGEMRRIATMPDGPAPLEKTAESDLEWIDGAYRHLLEGSWADVYYYFQSLSWVRAGSIKKDSCDKALENRAKALRDDVKDLINALKKDYFSRKPESLLQEIALMQPMMGTLVELVKDFGKVYEQMKIDRGIVDFSDLEHYALQILSKEENGRLLPTDIALSYRQQFAEVLVDEYQDINALQEAIINLVKDGDEQSGNLFMVGDVKQSIYGFRLAEPNLFLEKYERFTKDGANSGLKIDLNANFRSRKEVLDATNFIFGQIMGARVGGIEYDDAAALKYGAQYVAKEIPTTLTILSNEAEEETAEEDLSVESVSRAEGEAAYIIKEIQRLKASRAQVTDAFKKETREMSYKDVVILLRAKSWMNDFVEAFKQADIPVYAEVSKGYFQAIEVMIMLNTLRVIDNPYQDIPLVSVLRSPFIGLTENELAVIRLDAKNEPFFEAVARFVAKGGAGLQPTAQEKLQRFFTHFTNWRNLARHGSLASLIWQVYTDTYYYEMVGTMSNGKQRQANLRMLHDRAVEYEKTSFRGLFRFLRFIDRMEKRGDDFGLAKSLSDQEDVVRIMTIHASKGLEFPYVFVAGLGQRFNEEDFKASYLFDQHFGLAVKAVDPVKRITYTSLPYLAVKEKKQLEMRAEEMRVLYVAMTRAKESLTLVGSVKDLEKAQAKWQDGQLVDPALMLPEYMRSRARTFLDWIGPSIARHEAFRAIDTLPAGRHMTDPSVWELQLSSLKDVQLQRDRQLQAVEAESSRDSAPLLEQADEKAQVEAQENNQKKEMEKAIAQIKQRFEWTYDFEPSIHKRSKQTVSELKRLSLLEKEAEDFALDGEGPMEMVGPTQREVYAHHRPSFLQQRKLSAAEVGTAMHTVMEQIDFSKAPSFQEVNDLVNALVPRQLLTAEEAGAVNRKAIVQFFHHPLAKRLATAQKIYREIPFTYALPSEGDVQILQGIIDCLFEEADGWVLLDYKTDAIYGADVQALQEEMQARYAIQLNLYKTAVESILGIRVKEMLLYLFHHDTVIEMDGEEST